MREIPRELKLDYLREYPIGSRPQKQQRNVPLKPGNVPNIQNRLEFFEHSTFAWWQARRLEGREHEDDSEGIWPINSWRCEKRFGLPGTDIFPIDARLPSAGPAIYQAAREMRRLGYMRVADSNEAINVLRVPNKTVRFATEITSDWYDPPFGTLPELSTSTPFRGSHAVPLVKFDQSKGNYFLFPNSWGEEWGAEGWGAISAEHFDKSVIEAWLSIGAGLSAPYSATADTICLEWKWACSDSISLHGREIVDASSSENLAWAFCTKRDGFLDVEEFFVWPSERQKGFGKELARMVRELASSLNLPIRLLVSYADTVPENGLTLQVAARLLEVELVEAPQRWVHMIGISNPAPFVRLTPRPPRPAFVLELLRPRDEKPITEPIKYAVTYGTNRELADSESLTFTGAREGKLHTGVATVSIPATHQFGGKGRFWTRLWRMLTSERPSIVASKLFADDWQFREHIQTLREMFAGENHNLLYVHGFNVTFEQAVVQAAHFGTDLKIPGVTFAYSWPSAGRIPSYTADEAAVEASAPMFSEFFHKILADTGDDPLSIIVHSMGNRAGLRLLDGLQLDDTENQERRIKNVIFAAPDVDAQLFRDTIPRIVKKAKRTTLYATRADIALQASEWLHSYPRAGLAPPVLTLPDLDTVLVEDFNLLNLGHSYYAEAASLLHDMFILIHLGSGPKGRPALSPAMTNGDGEYWKLTVQ